MVYFTRYLFHISQKSKLLKLVLFQLCANPRCYLVKVLNNGKKELTYHLKDLFSVCVAQSPRPCKAFVADRAIYRHRRRLMCLR